MSTAIYAHMINRMNKDLIAQEIQKKELEASLRNKEMILATEQENSRKQKEAQL